MCSIAMQCNAMHICQYGTKLWNEKLEIHQGHQPWWVLVSSRHLLEEGTGNGKARDVLKVEQKRENSLRKWHEKYSYWRVCRGAYHSSRKESSAWAWAWVAWTYYSILFIVITSQVDSMAVSIFVVILVDFDKHWIWKSETSGLVVCSQVVLQTPTLSLLGKSAGKEERVEAAENSRKQIIIVSDKKLMNPYFQKLYVRSLRTFWTFQCTGTFLRPYLE